MPAFAHWDADLTMRPIKIIEAQGRDLPRTQSVAGQQCQNSVVTLAQGGAVVDAGQQAFDIWPRNSTWNR